MKILSAGYYKGEVPPELLREPDFRRASRNQIMTYLAVKECLKAVPQVVLENRERVGAVLGTSHGELESTVSFLSELGTSGTARPLFFQSSLHHSTLGFLTKLFSLTGPSLTVSHGPRSGEDALAVAQLLLHSAVDVCLVIGVDALVPKIQEAMRAMYPLGTILKEGAGALLLTRTGEGKQTPQGMRHTPLHYDSSAVEALARQFGAEV